MEMLLMLLLFCVGAIVSSFVSVITERVHTGQSWIHGRSRCDSCSEMLTSRDLIPVFSWIASAGRCRLCGSKVPLQHVIVEAVMGTLFVLAFVKLGLGLPLLFLLIALCALLFVVLYDLRHTVVLNAGSLTLLVFSALYAFSVSPDLQTFIMWVLGSALTGLFFFSLYYFSKGKAMGFGDTPVSTALALLAGSSAFSGFLFTFWIGGVVGIVILLARRGGPALGIEVPFVPFLGAGYLLAFFTQWNPFFF